MIFERVFSCNKLHATGALFHIVACILMHERFHLGAEWSAVVFERVFSCNELHGTRSIISYRSVHLDARPNHAQNVIHHLSGIHDFVQRVARYGSVISYCSVHLDARPISPRYGMKCGGFLTCFFVQRVARYGFTSCTQPTTMTHKGEGYVHDC